MKRLTAILLVIFFIVLVCGAVLVANWVQDIPDELAATADFQAVSANQAGVAVDSTFVVRFSDKVSSASLNRSLTVVPEISYGVHQGSTRSETLIVPSEPLAAGTTYVFTLTADQQEYSWAFQTQKPLSAVAASPAEKAVNVPVASSINITLDQLVAMDPALVENAFSISPAVEGSFSQTGRTLVFTPNDPLAAGTVYTVALAAGMPLTSDGVALAEAFEFCFETVAATPSAWRVTCNSCVLVNAPVHLQAVFSNSAEIDQALYTAAAGRSRSVRRAAAEYLIAEMSLYRLDTEEYLDLLTEQITTKPVWSNSYVNLSGCDASAAELVDVRTASIQKDSSGHLLEYPAISEPGCYILRLTWQNQSRDVLFCVSTLDAYWRSDNSGTLLWLHDAETGARMAASVTEAVSGNTSFVPADGAAKISHTGGAVLDIISNDARLVLPVWGTLDAEPSVANWRYLYLDKNVYQSGETLSFWGLVRPRDGSAMEYDRVSVYIYPSGEGEEVYFGYAPLANNLFSGEIVLPTLSDGKYELQLWQSGKELVRQSFWMGKRQTELPPVMENSGAPLLLDRSGAYLNGENFAAMTQNNGVDHLYLVAENGIQRYTVSDNMMYLGTFSPQDRVASWVGAVSYGPEGYQASQFRLVPRDYSQQKLTLSMDAPDPDGGKCAFTLQVLDAAGKPVGNAAVAVTLLAASSQPVIDTAGAIFADASPSGLWSSSEPLTPNYGETLNYMTAVTDENGIVSASLALPESASGKIWLAAQAIAVTGNVEAGSTVYHLCTIASGGEDVPGDAADSLLRPVFSNGLDGAAEISFVGDTQLLAVDSSDRIWMLSELCLVADESRGAGSVLTELAGRAARDTLCAELGPEMAALLAAVESDRSYLQNPDGGVPAAPGEASDLALSVAAAILAPDSVSRYDLGRYFRQVLATSADESEWIMALAGEAFCGRQVLAELQHWLDQDLSAEDSIWLAAGLSCFGDVCHSRRCLESLPYSAWSGVHAVPLAAARGWMGDTEDAITDARYAEDTALPAVAAAAISSLQRLPQGIGSATLILDGKKVEAELSEGEAFRMNLNDFVGTAEFESDDDLSWCLFTLARQTAEQLQQLPVEADFPAVN